MLESYPNIRRVLEGCGVLTLCVLAFLFTKYFYAPWSGAYTSNGWLFPLSAVVGITILFAVVALSEQWDWIQDERGWGDPLWLLGGTLLVLLWPIGIYQLGRVEVPAIMQGGLGFLIDLRFSVSGVFVALGFMKLMESFFPSLRVNYR